MTFLTGYDECPDEINGNKDTNTTENLQPVLKP